MEEPAGTAESVGKAAGGQPHCSSNGPDGRLAVTAP